MGKGEEIERSENEKKGNSLRKGKKIEIKARKEKLEKQKKIIYRNGKR